MSTIPRRDFAFVLLIAWLIAAASSRPFAGGWNDGSRLATIECLVDRGTFAIDDSIFVVTPTGNAPYMPDDVVVQQTGTLDRMRINGHYYSDKPAVPALYSAVVYKGLQLATGLRARQNPKVFCWLMHFLSAGLAYVVAVSCTFLTVREVGLPRRTVWSLTLAFALATIALAYAKHVNGHILLLGVTSLLLWLMLRAATAIEQIGRRFPWLLWLSIGILCGLAYAIDLGAGPVICLGAGGWALFRMRTGAGWSRRIAGIAVLGIAALPWVLLHHAISYSIAGSFGPAGANPDAFNWPGSPFNAGNMTGRWNHGSIANFVIYTLDILVGQKGFFSNNLMLYLPVVGLPLLLRTKLREKRELLCGFFWCAGIVLMYSALSNNFAGGCVSIRWFVPLLAPGFFMLALLLRQRPKLMGDFWILTGWSMAWAMLAWWYGPWWRPPLILYWMVLACGLIHWTVYHLKRVWEISPNGRPAGLLLQFCTLGANNTVTSLR